MNRATYSVQVHGEHVKDVAIYEKQCADAKQAKADATAARKKLAAERKAAKLARQQVAQPAFLPVPKRFDPLYLANACNCLEQRNRIERSVRPYKGMWHSAPQERAMKRKLKEEQELADECGSQGSS